GGARAIKKLGDRCFECHEGEQDKMGAKIVSGEKAEKTPIPGKRGHIKVNVKAAHDDANLYLHFQWEDAAHTPVPFVDGGKMDPDNQIKLAVMFDDGKVEKADHAGCWATCHHDSRYMPDHPADQDPIKAGVTKYLLETKTEWEVDTSPRGAWNKSKPEGDVQALMAAGQFMDLVRYDSGHGGKTESGFVLDHRVMEGGQPASFTGGLKDGVWTVTMTRPLKAEKPGFVSFEPGQLYTMGFAIHDDFTTARFHHVSLEYKLGLDNPEAEVNAIKQ
ncbi:MAG: ethylbenzene dehydrogenase-related protein, partial [Rhodospirillales bacterium]|nr:ethylbenzene dehydrogenase-related protein [Rhodospirillales bacterium]